jgi:hypothetical protein
VGRDLIGEWCDLIYGCTDDDQLRISDCIRRGIGYLVAPRLSLELQPGFRSPRPDRDMLSRPIMPGGSGDGSAEKSGSENGDLIKHGQSEKV